jgi:integrase
MGIKVTLRQKPIGKGMKSLYLDFHPPIKVSGTDKTTRREFLGLNIVSDVISKEVIKYSEKTNKPYKANITVLDSKGKPKKRILTPIEKLSNKQTLQLAEQICQKRHNKLNKPEVYSAFELEQIKVKEKSELSFIDYFEQQMEKRTGKNYLVWTSSFHYLKNFAKDGLKFANLDEKFCNDYKDYLQNAKSKRSAKTNIKKNTAHSYFNKFKATLKQAFKDKLLPFDLNASIETIKQEDTKRVFLSLEELNQLVKADCPNPILKQASLFSALTGLRFSDIAKLKWREVMQVNGQGYFLEFQQQKTKSNEYSPISEQAYNLLGEPQEPQQNVFEGLKYSAHQNSILLKWVINAGIQKHLTFHVFRHTYATLQIAGGTDIYTVQKMLGHKDLKTTQIYAKVVDKMKRDTTNKIKLDL